MSDVTFPSCPAWVTTGTININQAKVLIEIIGRSKARNIIEVGTASGFSAVMIATALAAEGPDWTLDTIDYGETCYFDATKRVGQCIDELLAEPNLVNVHRSSTSLDIPRLMKGRTADFAYVDASHSSPWAAVDILSLLTCLRPNAIIGLDDILLPFREGYSHQNASRDIYRLWRGPKWSDQRAPNLALLRIVNLRQAVEDIVAALNVDWDEDLSDDTMDKIQVLLKHFADTDYTGRVVAEALWEGCSAEVHNGNPFIRPSSRPFARISVLHPNADGDDPMVAWRGLSAPGLAKLHIAAVAFNPSKQNPGAELDIRLVAEDGEVTHSEVLTLEPLLHAFSQTISIPESKFDLEIVVRRRGQGGANFAGVRLERLIAQ